MHDDIKRNNVRYLSKTEFHKYIKYKDLENEKEIKHMSSFENVGSFC